ncbi:MAG: type II toxin-antitoxin system VapB family antitoxin [Actinomycetota bacterium]
MNLLIRGLTDEVVMSIDSAAQRLGISRSEYLRRELSGLAGRSSGSVTKGDLLRFADAFGDLGDPEVMRRAWE